MYRFYAAESISLFADDEIIWRRLPLFSQKIAKKRWTVIGQNRSSNQRWTCDLRPTRANQLFDIRSTMSSFFGDEKGSGSEGEAEGKFVNVNCSTSLLHTPKHNNN